MKKGRPRFEIIVETKQFGLLQGSWEFTIFRLYYNNPKFGFYNDSDSRLYILHLVFETVRWL